MDSIDRKLARCARELAESKPKGLSCAEFEAGDHDLPVTATECRTSVAELMRSIADALDARIGVGMICAPKPLFSDLADTVSEPGDAYIGFKQSKPAEQATPAAGFKVGDRVTTTENGPEWSGCVYVLEALRPHGSKYGGQWDAIQEDGGSMGILDPAMIALVLPC